MLLLINVKADLLGGSGLAVGWSRPQLLMLKSVGLPRMLPKNQTTTWLPTAFLSQGPETVSQLTHVTEAMGSVGPGFMSFHIELEEM